MDPEDVLDFGEDDDPDDGDLISLGGSDHNGEPVPTSHSSLAPGNHNSSRTGRSNKSPPAAHKPTNKISTASQQSSERPSYDPSKPAPAPTSSSKTSNGKSAPAKRPVPGERASYMPPDRPAAARFAEAAQAHASSKSDSRRSLPGSSDRSAPQHDSHSPPRSNAPYVKSSDKPVPQSVVVDPAGKEEPESEPPQPSPPIPRGWVVRVSSRQGKTYYVNAITRTSQWHLPTEPATGVPPTPAAQLIAQEPSKKAANDRPPGVTPRRNLSNGLDRRTINHENVVAVDFAKTSHTPNKQETRVEDSNSLSHGSRLPAVKAGSSPTRTSLDSPAPAKEASRHADHPRHPPQAVERSSPKEHEPRRTLSIVEPDTNSVRSEKPRHVAVEYPSKERYASKSERRAEDEILAYRSRDRIVEDAKVLLPGPFHRDSPPHQEPRSVEGPPRSLSSRHLPEESPRRSREHERLRLERPRSLTPPPRRYASPIIEDRDRKYREAYVPARESIPLGPSRAYNDDRASQRSSLPDSSWHHTGSKYESARSAPMIIDEPLPSRHYESRGLPQPPREPAAYRNPVHSSTAVRSSRAHFSPSPPRHNLQSDRREYQREVYRRLSRSPSPPRSRTRAVYPARYPDERSDHPRDARPVRYPEDRIVFERSVYPARYPDDRVERERGERGLNERDAAVPSRYNLSPKIVPSRSSIDGIHIDPLGPRQSISGAPPPRSLPQPPLSADRSRVRKRGPSPSPPPTGPSLPRATETTKAAVNENSPSLASRLGPVVADAGKPELGPATKRKKSNNNASVAGEVGREIVTVEAVREETGREEKRPEASRAPSPKIIDRVNSVGGAAAKVPTGPRNHHHDEKARISLRGRASRASELSRTVDEQMRPFLAIFDEPQPATSLRDRIQDLDIAPAKNNNNSNNNGNSLAARVRAMPGVKGGSLNQRLCQSPPTGPKHISQRISGQLKPSTRFRPNDATGGSGGKKSWN